MSSTSKWLTGLMSLALLAGSAGGQSQEQRRYAPPPVVQQVQAADQESHVVMEWETFKKISGWDERTGAEDRNRFVIPWAEVQSMFNINIRGVNTAELKLPWREFKTLLEWSVREAERKRSVDPPPPAPYLINAAEYIADEISKDGAKFLVRFEIEILEAKGWKKIEVLPGNVAIQEARLPRGVHLQLDQGKMFLLTKKMGEIVAEIEFSVAVQEAQGRNTITFTKTPSGTCMLDVTIPTQDVEVNVAQAQSKLVRQVRGGTRVVAALPATTPLISISWERAIPEAEKVPPKIYSETRTLLSVADGLLLGQSQISLSILHTPTRQLTLNAPGGISILNVAGRDIRDWRVSGEKLTIQFTREVIGSLTLSVSYEKPLAAMSGQTSAPVITVEGVEREKGHIGVVALTNVEIKSSRAEGAHLVDVKSLPPEIMGMTNQPVLLGYRYVTPEFQIELDINKHDDVKVLLTVIDRAHFTIMQTFEGRRIVKGIYNVRNNRNQFLRVALPAGAELWSAMVAGKSAQPAQDAEGRVLLPLVRSSSQGGLSAFPVEIVYVEEGSKPNEKGHGEAKVELPTCSEPITHLMVTLYAPPEGKYKDFDGTLRNVERFKVFGGPVAVPITMDAQQQAQQLQQQFTQQNAKRITRAGGSPIEVQLPLSGKVFRLEKILVVKDRQWFSYAYTGLKK